MRPSTLGTIVSGFVLAVGAMSASPCVAIENRVTVESRSFYPGQDACTVGVYVENAIPITAIVAPLEFRTLTGGAYPASNFKVRLNPASRVAQSPLGWCIEPDSMEVCPAIIIPYVKFAIPEAVNSCSGPESHTWAVAAPSIDFSSPDATMFAVISTGDPSMGEEIALAPGVDEPTVDQATLWLMFDAGAAPGQFEIDTCCTTPANHLLFADTIPVAVYPAFTKGIITIGGCSCPCAGDPNCDGTTATILDLTQTINVAFRNHPETFDLGCPRSRTDVNCDGVTNIIDAVRVSLVAFVNYDPAVYFCNPCE